MWGGGLLLVCWCVGGERLLMVCPFETGSGSLSLARVKLCSDGNLVS